MEIRLLDKEYESEYNDFLLKCNKTIFTASNKFRELLKTFINCNDYYLIALSEKKIVGVLPCFIKNNPKYGNVLNSLPYYGSSGAIIEHEGNERVKESLLDAMKSLCSEHSCVASTIVTSPFEKAFSFYQYLQYDFIDSRRGLINYLPKSDLDVDEGLMLMYTSVRRNNIRKARKSNIEVKVDNSKPSFDFLYETHFDNMTIIGGKPKEKSFFDAVLTLFQPGEDYDIYTAVYEGIRVAAMLVFYFNKTVEYFTPVVVSEYRTYNPLNLVIHIAMVDAAKRGYKHFNWGGTGVTQESLYKFKSQFGAVEHVYYYYSNIYDNSILSLTKDKILEEYVDFFVYPFNQLQTSKEE